MSGNGQKDPADTPEARRLIDKIKQLGKTGSVADAFKRKYGKKKPAKEA